MTEIHYFQYDVGQILEHLTGSAMTFFENEDAWHDKGLAMGCFVVQSYSEHTPSSLNIPVTDVLRHSPTRDVIWFSEQVKTVCPDAAAWFSLGNMEDVDAFFRNLGANESVNTLQLLSMSWYCGIKHRDRSILDIADEKIEVLLNKFEVFGRIFDRYDSDFRKIGEGYDTVLNYSLLSLVLLNMFGEGGGLHLLNGALKLNDVLVALKENLVHPSAVLTAIAALSLGMLHVGRFYESQGFRMPCCRKQ